MLILVLLFNVGLALAKEELRCANSVNNNGHFIEDVTSEDGTSEDSVSESPYINCPSNYCYTFWKEDLTNGSIIIRQGNVYVI